MLTAALSGDLDDVSYNKDKIFGFEVPDQCPAVPSDVLNPVVAWPSESEYTTRYRDLASRFIDNFRKFEDGMDPVIKKSGPTLML
jgi:phosphoenolpyruvate carboxykinase (ATP)